MRNENEPAKLRLAMAAMGKPETKVRDLCRGALSACLS